MLAYNGGEEEREFNREALQGNNDMYEITVSAKQCLRPEKDLAYYDVVPKAEYRIAS